MINFLIEPGRFAYDPGTIRMVYTRFGRIAHHFIGHIGPHIMDDFGTSVRVDTTKANFFVRGALASQQPEL